MAWKTHYKVIVILVLLIGFLIRLVPLLPPEINLIRHVPDDAYYLYCEADNLANGKGLSFDGVNPTTSGRPLYIVFLAGVDLMVGRANLPWVAYSLGVIAELLTALLIIRFLRNINLPPPVVILGMVFYISSAKIIFYGVNGMETPFAILSIMILLNLYQMKTKTGSSGIPPAIARGITLAVMMLLRLDYIFLVVPVILYEVWLDIKRRNWDWFWVGAAAGLIMAPWVWWSMATNGSLLPPSSDALTFIFAPKFTGGLPELLARFEIFLNASNTSMYLIIYLFKYNITASLFPLFILFICLIRKIELRMSLNASDIIISSLLGILVILSSIFDAWRWIGYLLFVAIIIYILIILARRYIKFRETLFAIAPVTIGFIALVLFYITIRLFFRPWNMIEGGLILSLILGALCAALLKRRFGPIYILIVIGWVMASNIIITISAQDKGPYPSQERFYRAAMWVRENTPPGTVIAAANGGIIQWYGGRTLVDAAGIEDLEAYKALKSHSLYHYLKQRGVQYLIDPKETPFKYYVDYWGVDIGEKLMTVYDTDALNQDTYSVPGVEIIKPIIYQLE